MRDITFTLWTRNEGEQHDSRIRCHDTSPQEAFNGVFREIDQTPELIWLIDAEQPEDVRKVWAAWTDHACETGDCPHTTQKGCDNDPTRMYRDNVAIGVTIRTQADADRLIPELLKLADLCPVLFVRLVPTEAVDLTRLDNGGYERYNALTAEVETVRKTKFRTSDTDPIHWLTLAGDTEPLHPDWVRSARDQCAAAGVPFRFEGWGEWWPVGHGEPPEYWYDHRKCPGHLFGDGTIVVRVGRERSGRTLDGVTCEEYPEAFYRSEK